MSGGLLAEWAVSNRPIGETEKLAKELNCKVLEDSAKLKKCLRGKSVHEFMDAVLRMVNMGGENILKHETGFIQGIYSA
jgi:hypothetical protein